MADPNHSDEDDAPLINGPSLSSEGQLEGRFGHVEAPSSLSFEPPPAQPPVDLQERRPKKHEPRVEVFRDVGLTAAARRRKVAVRVAVAFGLLGAAAVPAFVVLKPEFPDVAKLFDSIVSNRPTDGVQDGSPLSLGSHPTVVIDSTPSGASVTIDGELVGETPWAGDNRWSSGRVVPVRLAAPGYKPWVTELKGDVPATISATLRPQAP